MDTILIIANLEKVGASELVKELTGWLRKKKILGVILEKNVNLPKKIDFAISLGGDGTMLKSARFCSPKKIPVFGVNLGSLGFLAETDIKDMYKKLEKILKGDFKIEERIMLHSVVYRNEKCIRKFLALNDVVIKNGASARVINLGLKIDKENIASYVADGLIIATPTGSTAYSLACGGPILNPELDDIVISPIAPHTLTQRPLIISNKSKVLISVDSNHMDVIVSIDGQEELKLLIGDNVSVELSDRVFKLIKVASRTYYELLRTKLKWGL